MSQPYRSALSVTPSDTTVFSPETRGIYVGTTGDLAVKVQDGTSVLFKAVPAGALLPISVVQVLDTDTTASTILALF
jgi:hypothetical protein